MMRSIAVILTLVSLATACTLVPGNDGTPENDAVLSPRDSTGAPSASTEVESFIEEPDRSLPQRTSPQSWSGDEETGLILELWRDPSFQRRFTESYLAETDIEPPVTTPERETLKEILDLISAEKLDEAIGLLEENIGEASSAVFDFTLANIHFQQEKLELAAVGYAAAVEKYAKFRRAWRNLGLINIRHGVFEEAVTNFSKVIELGGGDAMTYGLLGFAYMNLGNSLSAESAYRMATMLDPTTRDWKMGLARSFFKQARYADAVSLCRVMIAEHPEKADLWLLQANAYIGLEKPLEAAKNYELIDRMGKSTMESLTMLADIYINEGLYEMAVAAYLRAMEMDPSGRTDRALRAAKVLTSQGAFEETEKLIQGIESLHGKLLEKSERKELLKLRARMAVARGAGEEEAEVLQEIVDLDPLDGEALILLGQHKGRSGDIEEAIFLFERAESLEKFEADAKVRHAQLLVSERRYTEALPLLRHALKLKPRDNLQEYLEQVERIAKNR